MVATPAHDQRNVPPSGYDLLRKALRGRSDRRQRRQGESSAGGDPLREAMVARVFADSAPTIASAFLV